MAMAKFARIPDEFSMYVFLQRAGSKQKTYLPMIDVPLLVTGASIEGGRWICGLCGRGNALDEPTCGGCGAPPKYAKSKGRIRLESWLPYGGVLHSLDQMFTLYVVWKERGGSGVFYDEEIVYILSNCHAGPVQAVHVSKGCIEEGMYPEVPRVSCDIDCDCVYVGAPWKEDEEGETDVE